MRKSWLLIGVMSALLSACTLNQPEQQQEAPPAYTGPVVEIGGVEPRYEPYNPGNLQDYRVNGTTYRIVQNPDNFSETGLATWYGAEASGNRTALGEVFDPNALTAAHPTLPIPSYVRVTNLSNGRQIVVRVNDRGPYTPGRIIDLSQAAGNRLNISNNTRVRVDFIKVAEDGSLSGPGSVGTTVAKRSFALPERPELGSSDLGTPVQQNASTDNREIRPVDNATFTNAEEDDGVPVTSPAPRRGGFLGAPTPLRSGVLEGSAPAISQPGSAAAFGSAPVAAPNAGGYLVQVGALSNPQRAKSFQQELSQRFNVPGLVAASDAIYRVQLGPFSSRQQAVELQQRLSIEAQQQSFIIAAPQSL